MEIPSWAEGHEGLWKKRTGEGYTQSTIRQMIQVKKLALGYKVPAPRKPGPRRSKVKLGNPEPKVGKWRCPECGVLLEIGRCVQCEMERRKKNQRLKRLA